MRKFPVILLAVEFVVAAVVGQLGIMHRPALDRAWLEWHQHPTTETFEALERTRITEVQRWGFSGVLFAVLAGATILVYRVRRGERADVA